MIEKDQSFTMYMMHMLYALNLEEKYINDAFEKIICTTQDITECDTTEITIHIQRETSQNLIHDKSIQDIREETDSKIYKAKFYLDL